MPHQLLNSKKEIRKQLLDKLEIGAVPLKDILRLSQMELLVLYEIFFEFFFGVKASFSAKLLSADHDFIVCVPSDKILPSEIVYQKMEEFFMVDGDIELDKFNGRRSYTMDKNYILRTSIASKEIHSEKYVKNRHSQLVTFLEAQIIWLFYHWLTSLKLDQDTMIVTRSLDSRGNYMILDCLNSKVCSCNFATFGDVSLFHTREIICKY